MQSSAVQTLVVIMMFAVGLELTPADLVQAPRRGRWFVVALLVNVVAVPVGAWLLADALGLSVGLSAGVVLLAASPGGPVGPVLARIAGADLGFATGLMVLLGIVGLVSSPLTVSLLLDPGAAGGVFWPMFRALLAFQIVPLALAAGLRYRFAAIASRLARPAGLASNVLLVVIIAALVIARGATLADVSVGVHAALIAALSALLAPVLVPMVAASLVRGLCVVTAVRNISVALMLAASFFEDPEVEVAILVCAFWTLVLAAAFGLLARWRSSRPARCQRLVQEGPESRPPASPAPGRQRGAVG